MEYTNVGTVEHINGHGDTIMKILKKILFSTPALFIYICITVFAAQQAIVSTDTLNEAWTKETSNNSDLQANIDLKANITSANLVTPDIGVATGTSLVLSGSVTAVGNVIAGPSTDPATVLRDEDGAGETIDDKLSGAFRSNMTTTTEDAEVSDSWLTYMDAGTETDAMRVDGSDNVVFTGLPFSSGSLTPVTGDADDFASTFTGRNLYGGTYIINGTGTAQLPEKQTGMNFTLITSGDILAVVNCHINDGYMADGTTAVEGSDITNLSTSGDIITIQNYTTDDWLMTTNGWTP